MHALVRTVCSRLHVLDPAEEEAKLADNGYDAEEQDGKMNVASKLAEGSHDADTAEIAVEPASPTLARPQCMLLLTNKSADETLTFTTFRWPRVNC